MNSSDDAMHARDPRLTDYALGESGAAEKEQIERWLAADPESRELVDQLRATATALEHDYALELASCSHERPHLAASHVMATASAMSVPRRIWLHVVGQASMLAAASVVIGGSLGWYGKATVVAEDEHVASVSAFPAQVEAYVPSVTTMPLAPDMTVSREAIHINAEANLESTAIGVGHGGSSSFACAVAPSKPVEHRVMPFAARQFGGGARPGRAGGPTYAVTSNTESYASTSENAFKLAAQDPLSTFSIDVDTASYSNARRFLQNGQLPPPDAVRIEEFVNYFRYAYPEPQGDAPFSNQATVASCPWAQAHKLVQIGLRARAIERAERPKSNLVFLIDVSGSMAHPLKLPLLVRSMRLLVDELDERDRVAIVVYAGASGLVLPSTECSWKSVIVGALDALQAGGSTNGGAGIELAYKIAAENFITDGQNRVVLCTDGDFNVGVTSEGDLVRLVEEKRKSGVFLSVLGFGEGNLKDSTMELLADKGNGNYAYVDSLAEARKVLVAEMGGTLFTVAKDVKLQVEFNPARVRAWRLIGYENRVLAHQDFNDDKKDAGDIGAGHTVTALYEVVPVGVPFELPGVDPLRYQETTRTTSAAASDELVTLKLRYKTPEGDTSRLISTPVADSDLGWQDAGADFQFAAAVVGFGMLLQKSPNAGSLTLADVLNLAAPGLEQDAAGLRREFVELVRRSQALSR
jgi:Ca-activated chloride channel family protein